MGRQWATTEVTHTASMIADASNSMLDCSIERRADGVLLVRVASRRDRMQPLPDAVFTFRAGDPQYDYWQSRFIHQQSQQS
jgi:hypothetical protein